MSTNELENVSENEVKLKNSSLIDSENCFYVGMIYILFSLIWILIVLYNRFYTSPASFILIIPLILFTIGYFNCDKFNVDLQNDVFRITFISVGLLLSLPLLKFFTETKPNKQLDHVIYLAMIFVLVSYYHVWLPLENRHTWKAIQSCFETFSVTFYIFALTIFFLM